MKISNLVVAMAMSIMITACTTKRPKLESVAENWSPAQLQTHPKQPLNEPGVEIPLPGQPKRGPVVLFDTLLPRDILVAPLSTIDIERLQKGLDEYDVITVGPSSLRDYKGQQELLDHLAEIYRFSRRQQNILREGLKHGGVLWVYLCKATSGFVTVRRMIHLYRRCVDLRSSAIPPSQYYLAERNASPSPLTQFGTAFVTRAGIRQLPDQNTWL